MSAQRIKVVFLPVSIHHGRELRPRGADSFRNDSPLRRPSSGRRQRLQDTRHKTKKPLPKEARHSCRALLRNFNREWTRMDAKMKSDWICEIGDWGRGKKPLLPRSWSILLQSVLGASRSKHAEPRMDIPRMARLFQIINAALSGA